MVSLRTIWRIAAVAVLLNCAAPGFAQNSSASSIGPDFSATQVANPGGVETSMRIYRSRSNVRYEVSQVISMIYKPSANQIYKLMRFPDGSQQCVEARADQSVIPYNVQLLSGANVQKTPEGTEVVDGHSCKIESAILKRKNGTTAEFKVWEAEDLKWAPVKIESQTEQGSITILYRDIVVGSPDPALFEQPSKCTPVEKMGQVAPPEK
jgi:hypothetical protein